MVTEDIPRCDGGNIEVYHSEKMCDTNVAGNRKPPKSTVDRVLQVATLSFRANTGLPEREYG